MKNQRLHLTLKRVWFDAIARAELFDLAGKQAKVWGNPS
jgi:hypothetical protein